MKNPLGALIVASVFASDAFADEPAPYKYVVGEHVFVMLPGYLRSDSRQWLVTETLPSESGSRYEASGLYKNDGSVAPLWTIDWHAQRTHLSSDGRFLVRIGDWPSRYDALAVAFYDQGRLLREYLVNDLVARPAELPHSVSHFQWLATAELDDASKTFRLTTLQGERHAFDLASGRTPLMAQVDPATPRAAGVRVAGVGETFSLAEGERIAIPDADLLVELELLSYRRCPADALCPVADGPVVEYRVVEISTGTEVRRGPSNRTPPDRFPHFVLQMGSDGATYARFSVQDSVEWCETRASRTDEQTCWSQLADATGDGAYCQRIADLGLRPDACYRRLQ